MKHPFLRNISTKTLAVALAGLLWVHVATDKEYVVEVPLPVTTVTHAPDLALTEAPPDTIVALLSASGKTLLRGGWRRAGVAVRLDYLRIGQRDVRLDQSNVSLVESDDIKFHEIIRPKNFRFTLDRLESKTLPVAGRVTVRPAPGFAVGASGEIRPETITVRGPRATLQGMSSVFTEARELVDVRSDIALSLALDSAGLYGIEFDPDVVTFRTEVTAVRERSFDHVPVALFNAPDGPLELTPSEITLIISGPETEIDQLDAGQISVSANFRKRDSFGMIPLQVSLPSRLKLVNISDSLTLARVTRPESP